MTRPNKKDPGYKNRELEGNYKAVVFCLNCKRPETIYPVMGITVEEYLDKINKTCPGCGCETLAKI